MKVDRLICCYVDQGGGKRKGSFAVYLEPWHADIFDFLDLRKNHGKEELRARDLTNIRKIDIKYGKLKLNKTYIQVVNATFRRTV